MAALAGTTFVRCALAPLGAASASFVAGCVAEGLAALAPDRLKDAWSRGVARAARRAGAGRDTLRRMLPLERLEATLAEIRTHHAAATAAWNELALGGPLSGVGSVTITTEGKSPGAGWYLGQLAQKFRRDGDVSAPLEALSSAMTRWEDQLVEAGAALDRSRALDAAHLRKWLLLGVGAGALAAVAAGGAWHARRVAESRERVAAALGQADACAAQAIDAADLGRATDVLREEHARRSRACDERRAAEAREARCAEYAAQLDGGAAPAGAPAEPRGALDLEGRIARAALAPADLRLEASALPCASTRSEARVARAFARAACASAPAWAEARVLSDTLRRALLEARICALGEASRRTLQFAAEETARTAIRQGNPERLADARQRCDLAAALGIAAGPFCTGLARIPPPAP